MDAVQRHFKAVQSAFGASTVDDLTGVGHPGVAQDLQAALAACTELDFQESLVSTCAVPVLSVLS